MWKKEKINTPAEFEATMTSSLRKKLRQAFREGVKRLCVRWFWPKVEAECKERLRLTGGMASEDRRESRQSPAVDIASIIDLAGNQLYAFQQGGIGFEVFYVVMSALDWEYGGFDPPPPLKERVYAGYEAAVFCYQESPNAGKIAYPSPGKYLPGGDLESLLLLFAGPEFIELRVARAELTTDDWTVLAEGVNARAEKCVIDGESLHACFDRWGNALLRVRRAVPYRWLDEDSGAGT